MKFFILTLLLTLPALASANPEQSLEEVLVSGNAELGATESESDLSTITWMDDGHAYATDRAQELTEWMDSFFGDTVYDIEKPQSLVRLEWANKWDEHEDDKSRVRLRGKLRLPQLSERLNLVFSGDDGDVLPDNDDNVGDTAGLLYEVSEKKRSRVDLTLGIDWDGLRPGIRFRNQGPISDKWGYRYTQRLEWETDEEFFTTTQFHLDHLVDEDTLVRWASRVVYGEETEGVEWRTGVSLGRKWNAGENQDPYVISYFGQVTGVTDPSYVENYRLGMVFRRQLFRRYFFVELEPSYNFRKIDEFSKRDRAWNAVLRFEVLFETKRRRTRKAPLRVSEPAAETELESSAVSFPAHNPAIEAESNPPPRPSPSYEE
jgi:hypothetical protein